MEGEGSNKEMRREEEEHVILTMQMKMRREGKEGEDCGDEYELGTNDGNSAEVDNGDRQQ